MSFDIKKVTQGGREAKFQAIRHKTRPEMPASYVISSETWPFDLSHALHLCQTSRNLASRTRRTATLKGPRRHRPLCSTMGHLGDHRLESTGSPPQACNEVVELPGKRSAAERVAPASALKARTIARKARMRRPWPPSSADGPYSQPMASRGQSLSTTLPATCSSAIGPKARESRELVRLSPITQSMPSGTTQG